MLIWHAAIWTVLPLQIWWYFAPYKCFMAKGSFIISNIHYSGCFHNSSLLENLLALFSFSFLFAPLVKLMKTKEAPFPMWEQLKGNEVILYTCVISVYNSKNNIYFTWSVWKFQWCCLLQFIHSICDDAHSAVVVGVLIMPPLRIFIQRSWHSGSIFRLIWKFWINGRGRL